jgi:drug/metabolite transporter (DMT)-like permease
MGGSRRVVAGDLRLGNHLPRPEAAVATMNRVVRQEIVGAFVILAVCLGVAAIFDATTDQGSGVYVFGLILALAMIVSSAISTAVRRRRR